MKKATYHTLEGKAIVIEYDENASCTCCGLPVVEASMSGTKICPWCDMGRCRYCRELFLTGHEKSRAECEAVIRIHIAQCKPKV